MLISPQKDTEVIAVEDIRRSGERASRFASLGRFALQMVLMLVVLAGAFAAMNGFIAARPERPPRVFEPTVYAVETVDAVRQDNRPMISLFGEVVANRDIDLRAQVTGEIVSVHPDLRVGEHVEAGDELVKIDPFAYEGALTEAQANLVQAEAALREVEAQVAAEQDQLEAAEMQLQLGQSDLQRALSLADRGAATQQQIDERRLVVSQRQQAVSQSRNNLLVLEAQRDQQEANIERLQWLVRQAERDLENTTLAAPFSGVVSEAVAEPGRIAGASDVIASIYDDSMLEARFTLTDAQYGRIVADERPLVGRAIEVRWNVGAQSYSYEGTIDRLGATVVSDRGGVEVYARLQPVDHAVELRPGAFLEIGIPDRLYAESIRLPESAVYDSDHVFVIADGRLQRREIEVLAFENDHAVVRGNLQAGDRVMSTRLTEADEGTRVRVAGDPVPVSQTPSEELQGETRQSRRTGGRGARRAFGG